MSPSRGTAAKSDAVLSERLTGQGEDARPAFGRREPACRGCAGVQGGHRKTTWREERVSTPGARPRTAALTGQPERPSRLRPVPCRPRPRPLLDQGPGGGLSASAKATPSMHCHPLGLAGPASCHRPSAFEARGAGEGTREDPGGGGPSGRAESAGPAGRQGILVPPRSPEGVGRDARFPRTRGTRFRTRRPSRRPWGSERHRRFSAACRFPGLRSPPSPCGPRANTLTLPRAIFTPDPK